ncbi:MAG TPA: CHAT domain-containing protein [Blastocatellia bacterium]|nr:CHAT domain-containing protein [Blastocatellia bacterium]
MFSSRSFGGTLGPDLESVLGAPGSTRGAGGEDANDVRELEPGHPIRHDLAAGQQQTYQIKLNAGQFLRVIIEQDGIDVVVRVTGPDDRQLLELDSESRVRGQESVTLVSEAAGEYRLVVQPRQRGVPAGGYEIRIEELRAATGDDRALEESRRLLAEYLKHLRVGRYDQALASAESALKIRERVLGPDHPDVAFVLRRMAILHNISGDHAQAEALFQRALDVLERSLGPEHPGVALALNNVAIIYTQKGDYVKAEPLFQRALVILEAALGREHLDFANVLDSLAALYRDRGDYVKAEPLYQRALATREKALGSEHLDVAAALNNLALLYAENGQYAKAEPLFQRALAIREHNLRSGHLFIADTLDHLSNLYLDLGDFAKAEPLLQRARASRERELGSEHPDVAQSLNSLAKLYRYRAMYGEAEPLFQRALAIREQALGPQHPRVAESLNELARLYWEKGDLTRAIAFRSRANDAGEYNLALNLATGSERQKLAYLALSSQETDFTLSLHGQTAPGDQQALELAFTTLLRRKGRALEAMTDTMAALRRQTTPQDQLLLGQLAQARSQLASLTLRGAGAAQPETYRGRLAALEEEVENLEARLSTRSAAFRAHLRPVTLAAIQALLPAKSALIEFALYTPWELQPEQPKPPRYVAYLLAPQGRPRWVDLGEAAVIDRALDDWRQALCDPNRVDVKPLARAVDEKVMRPVRFLLSELQSSTSRLLIAPDGSLNLIPFAALVDEHHQYLIKRYTISYLTSGRDLLRLQTSPPSRNAPLILANPAFGRSDEISRAADRQARKPWARRPLFGRASGTQGLAETVSEEIVFPSLPSTEAEGLAIKSVLPGASLLLREQATETALKQSQAPSLLHIATHGFFLGNQENVAAEAGRSTHENSLRMFELRVRSRTAKIENPLLRSGLALAGVNLRRSGDDDGLLTALEVASLDLWGTKMVVLSGCDTGVGQVRNGEGVYGLRRALVLAGSETQVMSLWPVSDRETSRLMAGYYKRLLRGEGRGEALRQIQLEMLKDATSQHSYYWASFIQAGEWANLDGRR